MHATSKGTNAGFADTGAHRGSTHKRQAQATRRRGRNRQHTKEAGSQVLMEKIKQWEVLDIQTKSEIEKTLNHVERAGKTLNRKSEDIYIGS